MSPTKNFFCNLSRNFVAPLWGKFPQDLLGVTDPEMYRYVFVAVNVAISDIMILCCWTEVVKTNMLDECTLTRDGKLYNPSDESYFRVSDKQLHLHI